MDLHPGTNPEAFETRILEKDESFLYLEETYCYPRGGGQPGDRGLITSSDGQSSNLLEVLPGEKIKHPVDDIDIFSKGEKITCEIDINVRNAHTMMHSAQHIFSALAEDIWGAETVGNQIGSENSRVDLLFDDKEVFDPDELVDAVKI